MIRGFCGTLRIIIAVPIVVLFMSLYSLGIKTFIKQTPQKGFKLRKIILKIINPILGISAIEKVTTFDKPALYICNHRGLLDFLITFRHIEAFILAKSDVERMPFVGFWGKLTGIFYVKRDNKSSRKQARKEIVNLLKAGNSVLLYPEGTVNAQKTTMDFKMGSFEEAAKHGFPVIPIAQEYKSKDDLWIDDGVFKQFYRQFGKCKSEIKISIGEPMVGDDPQELMNNAKNWIDSNLLEMQKNWSTAYD